MRNDYGIHRDSVPELGAVLVVLFLALFILIAATQ